MAWLTQNIVHYFSDQRSRSRVRAKTLGAKTSNGLSVSPIVSVDSRPKPARSEEEEQVEADIEKGYVYTVVERHEDYTKGPARMVRTNVEDGEMAVCLAVTYELSQKVQGAVLARRTLRQAERAVARESDALKERHAELYGIIGTLTSEINDNQEAYDMQRIDFDEWEPLNTDLERQRIEAVQERQMLESQLAESNGEIEALFHEYQACQEKLDLVLADVWTRCDLLDPEPEHAPEPAPEMEPEPEMAEEAVSSIPSDRSLASEPRYDDVEMKEPGCDNEEEIEAAEDMRTAWSNLQMAHRDFQQHHESYDLLEEEYIDAQVNRGHLDLKAEYSVRHLAENMRLTKEITKAEKAYEKSKRRARKVGCSMACSITSSYYQDDQPNHGYAESAERAEIESVDRSKIDRWMS